MPAPINRFGMKIQSRLELELELELRRRRRRKRRGKGGREKKKKRKKKRIMELVQFRLKGIQVGFDDRLLAEI